MFRIFLLILFLFSSFSYGNSMRFQEQTIRKKVRILSIDGGGIRGIIPIKILAALENKLGNGRSITDYFDIMCGTSAGGILVLLLNIPDDDGNPKYKATDVSKIYKEFGKNVFYRSPLQILKSMDGWLGDKYSSDNLQKYLNRLMGNYIITESVKDIIIPAFDLLEERNYFFKRNKALDDINRQFFMKDIALATSAAPTFFKPAEIYDIHDNQRHLMVDGGVSVNNPALAALIYAYHQYGENADYFVLSIGTGSTTGSESSKLEYSKMNVKNAGKLGWAKNIINLLMDSVNDVTDYQVRELVPSSHYYRLQVTILPQNSPMDDISDSNIKALEENALKFIIDNDETLNKIVENLK